MASRLIRSFAILDLEATDKFSDIARIIEIGVIGITVEGVINGREPDLVISHLVQPADGWEKKYEKSFAAKLTGITKEELLSAEPLSVVWPLVMEKIAKLPHPVCLLAHNGNAYDFKVIVNDLKRCRVLNGKKDKIVAEDLLPSADLFKCCTAVVCRAVDKARHIAANGEKSKTPRLRYNLGDTYERVTGGRYETSENAKYNSHRALGDCQQLLDIMQAQGKEFTDMVDGKKSPW